MSDTSTEKSSRKGLLATYTGIAAGCAGIDTAFAYGVATLAKVAVPAKAAISGITFGASFVFSFMALCLCKVAGDADDYMDSLMEEHPLN